ncbi:type II toxin-antitoxin system PemK/MazF family toxin (plasmid) [Phyllobacterium sp. 628]|uniref:type II toxin-antitoxin system PemK/MazF family toxin n=1 Tax=Phyllobacterium sp. 628 TaxID=2718938 RepID=UPI0016625F32|nr:type II toxin-antitoxin system PemK/MazF family toxin [Phyllobacterium sp. 628]QND54893.1 type II toxin-antitoxin system PemK/MazF family toxin [Phyllobacterium sp. 628]
MPTFKAGDIVRVPFPYTDRNTRQHRPALVVSDGAIGDNGDLLWVLMITSAENKRWAGDVSIPLHEEAGLPVASVIRPVKVATIEVLHADRLGQVTPAILENVRREIRTVLKK